MSVRLPAVGSRAVVSALQRAGFVVSRTSGSHCRLVHRDNPSLAETIPLHGGRDVKTGTLRAIIRQAGLSTEAFIALL